MCLIGKLSVVFVTPPNSLKFVITQCKSTKNFWQRSRYLSSVNKSIVICVSLGMITLCNYWLMEKVLPFCSQIRIFESLLCLFEKFNLLEDRKSTDSLIQDYDINYKLKGKLFVIIDLLRYIL